MRSFAKLAIRFRLNIVEVWNQKKCELLTVNESFRFFRNEKTVDFDGFPATANTLKIGGLESVKLCTLGDANIKCMISSCENWAKIYSTSVRQLRTVLITRIGSRSISKCKTCTTISIIIFFTVLLLITSKKTLS